MKKYVIERQIPGVGKFSADDLKNAAAASNAALKQLSPSVKWLESFVTADQTFCVYMADDEAVIHRHAELSGFPANRITEVATMIDPSTAAR
jgi:Protein of unknown function (DUF4242)